MSTIIEQLAEQAMNLPGESRARLADLLVASLDADALTELIDCGCPKRSEGEMKSVPVKSGRFLVTRLSAAFVTLSADRI